MFNANKSNGFVSKAEALLNYSDGTTSEKIVLDAQRVDYAPFEVVWEDNGKTVMSVDITILEAINYGGDSVSNIIMQTQADLLRLPVDRPTQVETTAFGAAALAGLAVGVWSGTEELEQLRRSQYVFQPQRDEAACAAAYRQWRRAVGRACDWIENEV